ncbi:hypothetical protein L1887_49694 [Cichorium endivia]|nr:hypothetical protein L1887_49694 [Cichorium endivia]
MLLAAKLFSMPSAEHTKHSHQEMLSRPGSAASVASSTSSFRIPGIQALAPPASRQSTPSDPSFVLPASYVRLFTPDTDAQATSQSRTLHMPSRQNVDWLNTHSAPPPREFLERSQTPREHPQPLQVNQQLHGQGHFAASESLRQSGPPDEPLRPFTASSYHRSRLVTADGTSCNYICAVLENRGTGREVGIASLERDTDTPTYVRTIHHMSLYPPSVLLVPASGVVTRNGPSSASTSRASKRIKIRDQGASEPDFEDAPTSDYRNGTSVLIRCLEELFDIQASPIPRRSWDYQEGARYLDRLLVDDIDQANEAKEIDLGLSSRDRQAAPLASQGSERPATSRPQTGLTSLDFSAKASTRAAILVAVADKFFLLSAVAALFEYGSPAGGWPRTRDSCNIC